MAGTPFVALDTFGPRQLLERPLLPVVCHRRDRELLPVQQQRCLEAARQGAALVSPRIAKGEQHIVDSAMSEGLPVVLVHDNGFAERYHPTTEQLQRCVAGTLLIVTPWRYRCRPAPQSISQPECKAMNGVAQAICRRKDSWWMDGQ